MFVSCLKFSFAISVSKNYDIICHTQPFLSPNFIFQDFLLLLTYNYYFIYILIWNLTLEWKTKKSKNQNSAIINFFFFWFSSLFSSMLIPQTLAYFGDISKILSPWWQIKWISAISELKFEVINKEWLPFLDVLVWRNCTGKLGYNVFRKDRILILTNIFSTAHITGRPV